MQGENNRHPQTRPTYRPIANQDVVHAPNHLDLTKSTVKSKKLHKKRWLLMSVASLMIVAIAVGSYLFLSNKNSNILPYPISPQTAGLLGFDIYYPNQKLLPPGYSLNMNSFSDSDQAIVYTVSYGNGQKIVFSDQSKPSTSDLQEFYAKNIPLHTSLPTQVGTAIIGAIKSQTVISLPTKTNAWLIITAPGNINQQQLDQILNSIQLSK